MPEENGWNKFIKLAATCSDVGKMDSLLKVFLTDEEQKAIATRLLIIEELFKQQLSQRDMANQLHVSIAKITRGSNFLKTLDDEMKAHLKESLLSQIETIDR